MCADEWDLVNADSVCRLLGYSYAIFASKGSQYGANWTIWEYNLDCTDIDVIPSECSYRYNSNFCSQGTAGVLCSTG